MGLPHAPVQCTICTTTHSPRCLIIPCIALITTVIKELMHNYIFSAQGEYILRGGPDSVCLTTKL